MKRYSVAALIAFCASVKASSIEDLEVIPHDQYDLILASQEA